MKLMAIRLTGAEGAVCPMRSYDEEVAMDDGGDAAYPWNCSWPYNDDFACDSSLAVRL